VTKLRRVIRIKDQVLEGRARFVAFGVGPLDFLITWSRDSKSVLARTRGIAPKSPEAMR
jgi:hypothetical protein